MQIREHAQATPDRPAVIIHPAGTVVTFKELEERANQLAHHFRDAGLVEGDTVAILMENNEHLPTAMWAARRSGLYYTVISTHLTPPEVAYILDNSGAKAMVGSSATRKVCEGLAELDALPELLLIAEGPEGLLGAVMVGLTANYVAFLAPKLSLASNMLLMMAVLLWRPYGLLPAVKR